MTRVLCVAEKPSIAREISNILSGGNANARQSPNKYIKNFDFSYGNLRVTVTAVLGHLKSQDFPKEYGWNDVPPLALFDAPIVKNVPSNMADVARNLKNESRTADRLMIWTDCDREGENIGYEIVEVCCSTNPRISIERARFSALIYTQIHGAFLNPRPLDMRQVDSVEARMELDLRVGACLTRLQTMKLQKNVPKLESAIVSYGPCQYPTLGFVVDRYERYQEFVPETFYKLQLRYKPTDTIFLWDRTRLFDINVTKALHSLCLNEECKVFSIREVPKTKRRPVPLNTVDFEKAAARLLHLSPRHALEIAERLYQKGFISYPRTETNQFDKEFKTQPILDLFQNDTSWGPLARLVPRNPSASSGSKNDRAHPPLHPLKVASSSLTNDEWKVYNFIVRHFLAVCSLDAHGFEAQVTVQKGVERFHATGLQVTERNFLDIYPFWSWDTHLLPRFTEGQILHDTECLLVDGETSRPALLTEADLVSLMDANGIGTDATIAEHIDKIIQREYVTKADNDVLFPTTLGIGLVKGYTVMEITPSLTKPLLRRQTEERLLEICEGTRNKDDVIRQCLAEYLITVRKVIQDIQTLCDCVSYYMAAVGGDDTSRSSVSDNGPQAKRSRQSTSSRPASNGASRTNGSSRGNTRSHRGRQNSNRRPRGRGSRSAR